MRDERTTIARNAILLVGLEFGSKALDLALAVVVANKLGAASFGLLNFAYGVAGIAILLPNFGLDLLAVRDVAADQARGPSYLLNGALLKLLLSPLALGAVLVFALASGRGGAALIVLMLGALVLLSDGFMRFVNAFFRARQLMQYEVLGRASLSVVNVATGLAVVLGGHGLVTLLAVRAAVYLVGLGGAAALLLTRGLFEVSWRPDPRAMWALARRAAPLAVLVTFTVIFVSIDTVMIGLMRGESEVGIYAAATRFTFVVLLLAGAYTEAVLPAMARRLGEGKSGEAMLRQSTRLLMVLALPIVGWFTWYANAWVGLLFSPAYAFSAVVLAILSWALLFDFMNHAGNRALIAAGHEHAVLWIVGGAAGFNIAANALLIPRFGAAGAALTTVATEALVFGAQTAALARRGMRLSLGGLLRPLVAFVSMCLALWAASGLGAPWYLGAPAAGLVYLGALLATHAIRSEELALVLALLRSPGHFVSRT